MALVTTVAGATSDSYGTVAEAETYFGTCDQFDFSTWFSLTEAQKERRMKLAALLLDYAVPFRGWKACLEQARMFPRIFREDDIFVDAEDPLDNSFETWEDCQDYADIFDVDDPGIPEAVKVAQYEIAFQIVHKHMMTLDPGESGEARLEEVAFQGIRFRNAGAAGGADFTAKLKYGSLDIIRLYLRPYIATIRMELI